MISRRSSCIFMYENNETVAIYWSATEKYPSESELFSHVKENSSARFTFSFCCFQLEINIDPQKGWETENLFVPPGFQIDSKIEGEGEKPKGETGEQPFIFPMGVGGLIMNGCFATNYQKGDPCYEAKWKTTICLVNEIFQYLIHSF